MLLFSGETYGSLDQDGRRDDAGPELREVLDLRGRRMLIDNVMRVHSPPEHDARPCRAVGPRFDDANTIAVWLQETISSYVSVINDCAYSYANHWKNAAHLIGDAARARRSSASLARSETAFTGAELALLRYAEKLTLTPGDMTEDDVVALRRRPG